MGHFEFRLCPNNNPAKPATQACLDRFNNPGLPWSPISCSDTSWSKAVELVRVISQGQATESLKLNTRWKRPQIWIRKSLHFCFQLPNDLTCVQCVFQWRYIAANNWGELWILSLADSCWFNFLRALLLFVLALAVESFVVYVATSLFYCFVVGVSALSALLMVAANTSQLSLCLLSALGCSSRLFWWQQQQPGSAVKICSVMERL